MNHVCPDLHVAKPYPNGSMVTCLPWIQEIQRRSEEEEPWTSTDVVFSCTYLYIC